MPVGGRPASRTAGSRPGEVRREGGPPCPVVPPTGVDANVVAHLAVQQARARGTVEKNTTRIPGGGADSLPDPTAQLSSGRPARGSMGRPQRLSSPQSMAEEQRGKRAPHA